LTYSASSKLLIAFTCDTILTSSDGKIWNEAMQHDPQPAGSEVRGAACSPNGRCVAISTSLAATPCANHPMWLSESSDGGATWVISCIAIDSPSVVPARIVLGGVATDGSNVFSVVVGPYVLYSAKYKSWQIKSSRLPMPVDGAWFLESSMRFLAASTFTDGLLSSSNAYSWTLHTLPWQFRQVLEVPTVGLVAIAAKSSGVKSNV
jgi:hypothetical protein